jgi:hypothetical protein
MTATRIVGAVATAVLCGFVGGCVDGEAVLEPATAVAALHDHALVTPGAGGEPAHPSVG